MKLDLKDAIENLYKVFQKYTIKGNLRGRSCDCCVTNDEIRELLLKPLKELSYNDIYHFMTSAVTTYGDVEDYKHFLPRILELMTLPKIGLDVIDDFLTFEKLNYSEWETWNAIEILAVDNFIEALWLNTLNRVDILTVELENSFMLCCKYVGVEKAIEILEEDDSDQPIQFIVGYVLGDFNIDLETNALNLFLNWIHSQNILNKIEILFFKTEDDFEANLISMAYTILLNNNKWNS